MAEMGYKFADVDDIDKLKRREWSSSAPQWRKTEHGLCLEGICKNSCCRAFGSKVIWNCGFTGQSGFVLEEDAPGVKCPICRKFVAPTTCAFNNCDWKVEGKKWISFAEPPTRVNQKFKRADNAYFIFDDNIQVNWLTLKITTVPNGQGCTKSGYQVFA